MIWLFSSTNRYQTDVITTNCMLHVLPLFPHKGKLWARAQSIYKSHCVKLCPICQLIKVCAYRVHFTVENALLHDLSILPGLRHDFWRYQIAAYSDHWCWRIWHRSCSEIAREWFSKCHYFGSRKSNRWTSEHSKVWWVQLRLWDNDTAFKIQETRLTGSFTFIDEYVVDLGAQWIHGEKGNVAYELVAPLNITDHSKPMNDEVYTSTGELIDNRITKNITDTYLTYFDTTAEFTGDKCQRSIGECIEHKYEFLCSHTVASQVHSG